jgi:dolichol-phosphate mannosyltransferase
MTTSVEIPELSVVVPTLNEAGAIAAVVGGALAEASALGVPAEAIVVDAFSSDGTGEKAARAGARVVEQGGGFAAGVLRGLSEARGRFVLTLDGDGSHPLGLLGAMWARREEAELVVASRFVPGGGADMPKVRYWLSRLLNSVFSFLMGHSIKDSSSGFRLYRRSALAGLEVRAFAFEFQQDVLLGLLARGCRVVEVPFVYRWRESGRSKARPVHSLLGYFRALLRHRFGLGCGGGSRVIPP